MSTLRISEVVEVPVKDGDKIAVIKNEPKPKRKYTRRKRRAKAVAPKVAAPKAIAELAGLTVTDCCKACSPAGCVISGRNYCAHPRKGGLQGIDMHSPDALDRLNRAKKLLGARAMELRYA